MLKKKGISLELEENYLVTKVDFGSNLLITDSSLGKHKITEETKQEPTSSGFS